MRKRSSRAMTPHSNPEWGVMTPHSTLKSWQLWRWLVGQSKTGNGGLKKNEIMPFGSLIWHSCPGSLMNLWSFHLQNCFFLRNPRTQLFEGPFSILRYVSRLLLDSLMIGPSVSHATVFETVLSNCRHRYNWNIVACDVKQSPLLFQSHSPLALPQQTRILTLKFLTPPVRTPGFKSRIRPPYPQRIVKGD